MKFRAFFAWFDFWIGAYYDVGHRTLYVCPLPMCVLRFELSGVRDEAKHRKDRATTTTKEALEPTVDAMWEALKAACCKNPVEAKLAVFVSEKKFKEALAPFTAPIAPVVDDDRALLNALRRVRADQDDFWTFYQADPLMVRAADRIEQLLAWYGTEQSMHAAWRKRAEEAELALTTAPASTVAPQQSLPVCPDCQQGDICEHCSKPIGDYYASPASRAAQVLHCSCGAACTPEEYEAHRAMGHDAPAAIRDEADQRKAAIALLDEWLRQPVSEDDSFGDELRRLIDENRLSGRKFWPELATTPPSTLAKAAAEEIADRWMRRDLPLKAAIHSNPRLQLQELAIRIIERYFFEQTK